LNNRKDVKLNLHALLDFVFEVPVSHAFRDFFTKALKSLLGPGIELFIDKRKS
jgi:hypothetical protein